MNYGNYNIDTSQRKPSTLAVLCIVTISSGILKVVLFSFLAIYLLQNKYEDSGSTGLMNALFAINTPFYCFLWILITLALISSAWMMWNLRKFGFYLYFYSAISTYLLPVILGGEEMMTIQRLFFSSVFIFLYGLHLKFLK
jgi:hypothetical protein